MVELILKFYFLTNILFAQSMDYYFIESEYDNAKIGRWTEVDRFKVAYKMYFKGACCDMPVIENMHAKIENDILYIDKAIPIHETHDAIGVCGISIDFVMKKDDYPNYENLKVSFIKTDDD